MRSWSFRQLGTSKNTSITDKPTGRLGKRRWVEPWYLSYAILGCTMGGMFPILIPLIALKRFSSACHVGLIMAAFNLGGLMAPIWGSVADRYKIHREVLTSGLIITAIALAALSFTNTFSFWLGLALIQGEHFIEVWFLCVAGASAIYTFYPIMMQEVYGMGQELLSLTFAVAIGPSVLYLRRPATWLIDSAR